MLALNMAIVSVHRVLSTADRIILDQEYQNIIENLNLSNIKSDKEIEELYLKLMDITSQRKLHDEERKTVERHYTLRMQNRLADSLSHLSAGEGEHFNLAGLLASCVASYFRYQSQEGEIRQELSESLYMLKAEDITSFNDMQKQLLSSSWKLMNKYHLPDEYRLGQKTMDDFYRTIEEADSPARKLRMLQAMEYDFKVYPPYWYYRAVTAQEAGELQEAEHSFSMFDDVWRPVLRKDPYKLEVMKYRLCELVRNGMPQDDEARRRIIEMLKVIRDNTLRDDWVNNIFAGAAYFALGEKEKGIACIQANIDFGTEHEYSTAMLSQMNKGVAPAVLAQDTLRAVKLSRLLDGLKEEYTEGALAVADYFDGRPGAVEYLEKLAGSGNNPLVVHALRIAEIRKNTPANFKRITELAERETALTGNIPAAYSGALTMVKSYADGGNLSAQIFLADMYQYGLGTAENISAAMAYYAKTGSADIYSQHMYLNDYVVLSEISGKEEPKPDAEITAGYETGMKYYGQGDYANAYECFLKSAQAGHVDSMYMLGQLFENGRGTYNNPSASRKWYQRAAEHGHENAKKALERMQDQRPAWQLW